MYVVILAGLALYGCLGVVTLFFYWRHRHRSHVLPHVPVRDLPPVVVQLPIYNEQFVVERLINAAAQLDYPRDRLHIQVCDDSADATTPLAQKLVQQWQQTGVSIELLHRNDRTGYKAGALQAALDCTPSAPNTLIAIFDADFAPSADFLHQTVPHFLTDDKLGVIQTRWGHLNQPESTLTRAQAIAIDKHFMLDQLVRHRADLFPKFNGSGGLWRRDCLIDAGGWQADTVCEDLCLSTRAVLQGWRFRLLDEVTASAELPNTIAAFKTQQARWAKGSIQCLIKFFGAILTARDHTLAARLYALFTMLGYFTNPLLILLLLLQLPMIALDVQLSPLLWLFTLVGLSQPLLFILGQQILYPDWHKRIRHFPALLLIMTGLTVSQTRAIIQALTRRKHLFVRTPKGMGQHTQYKLPFDWILLAEIACTLYALAGILLALQQQRFGALALLVNCAVGYGYITYLGIRELSGR
jgi:cellulose synthase/poly-beta-1,6-N-acetylglucosamine synthase-like glycosyltransferase